MEVMGSCGACGYGASMLVVIMVVVSDGGCDCVGDDVCFVCIVWHFSQ